MSFCSSLVSCSGEFGAKYHRHYLSRLANGRNVQYVCLYWHAETSYLLQGVLVLRRTAEAYLDESYIKKSRELQVVSSQNYQSG